MAKCESEEQNDRQCLTGRKQLLQTLEEIQDFQFPVFTIAQLPDNFGFA